MSNYLRSRQLRNKRSDPLLAPFVEEGRRAARNGLTEKDCPYGMNQAATGGAVLSAHTQARKAWMQGFNRR